jgi:hypothetical protein
VNQKGATSYNTAGAICIDRWVLNQNTLSLTAAGLKANTGSSINLIQYFEDERIEDGQTYTLSVLTDMHCVSISAVLDKSATPSGSWQMSTPGSNWYGVWAGLRHDHAGSSGKWHLRLTTSGDSTVIKAIKLELGAVQTLARQVNGSWVLNDPPPNYQQELAKCSTYLHIIKAYDVRNLMIGNANANDTGSVYWDMTIPIMVKAPSLTVVANKIGIGPAGFTLNPTEVSLFHYYAGHAVIGATGFTGLTTGQSYRIGLLSGGSMIFSAE